MITIMKIISMATLIPIKIINFIAKPPKVRVAR
jgi:hypothetical protein